ncbi:MAG: peptidase [Alphaproteobacteria bacterium]|nr:peptidase [Alphaproteobacteria bacterium]MBU0798555.1 peptidase [Alphaproteobacteria bacterium]MBU0889202.1 peptidase [Alphaproteobacteria bacterium]MBU1813791.1 peptidase [Alphaproteobacteria bacterium]MBU2089216.1 peptidase [Alphaproteobacteria bacterium]
MTYCLGIAIEEGLIALSDGRITSGTEVTQAKKQIILGQPGAQFVIMTSGLRSLRDKTVAYLRRAMREEQDEGYRSILDAVASYAKCLRVVMEEDREALETGQLSFNLHAIICGQLSHDREPAMFMIYPEGNWIEMEPRTPYFSIGATGYGKPILDRALTFDKPMRTALNLAYLSFDSTRFSASTVGFPVDISIYLKREKIWRSARYEYDDVREQREWWNSKLTELASHLPDGPWLTDLLLDKADLPALPRFSLVRED